MSEIVLATVDAGSKPLYEIVLIHDEQLRLRLVQKPHVRFDLDATVLPELIDALRDAHKKMWCR
jgi:hypothetical protein